jgi:DNA invertase Pin-like site-specific DNA recombinase
MMRSFDKRADFLGRPATRAVPRRHRSQRDRRRYRPLPLPISKLTVSKRYVSDLRASTNKQGETGLGVEAQHEAVRRYLFGPHGEQIAEFVEVESGKRSDRPRLAAAMALARRRKATLLVAKLDRLSRSVAFIATLRDSKELRSGHCRHAGVNRLTLHVLVAAAEHERHMIGERIRQALAAARARGTKLGNLKAGRDQPGKGGRAGSSLAPAHRALH